MTRTFWGTDSWENEGRIIIIITGNYDVKAWELNFSEKVPAICK